MGLIEVSPTTSPQRAAAIKIKLWGTPKRKPVVRTVIKIVEVSQPIEQDAHVNARYRYLAQNPDAMKKAIRSLVSGAVEEHKNQRLRAVPMIRDLCYYYGVTYADIISSKRTQSIVFPRQKMMWVIKKNTHFSYPEIGRKFGNRDHTTVLHSVRKIDALIARNDPSVADLKEWVKQ